MMAKVKLNPVLEQFRGQIGDLIFKRYGDETVISRKPDISGRELSPAQLAAQARFREAAIYGRMVMADPAAKALYDEAAQEKGKPVFSLTVADFFNAPEIHEIDLSTYNGVIGDEIGITASDDFEVTGVQVSLTDGDGNPIENGAAVETPANSGNWIYNATAAVASGTTVRIAVTASDRPGGTGTGEGEKTI
jgi:hypothetical protein